MGKQGMSNLVGDITVLASQAMGVINYDHPPPVSERYEGCGEFTAVVLSQLSHLLCAPLLEHRKWYDRYSEIRC